MVKAFGYGVGSYELTKTLQDAGSNYVAVAVADEGAELRKEGVTTGIIVMNPEPCSYRTLFDNKLEPEVYSFGMLRMLIEAARHEGITDYPIHIKIDTGMHRLGFLPNEIPALVELLKQQDALTPRSIFSHFAGSDSPLFDDFSKQQHALFNTAAETLQQAFGHKILRHICNSAASVRFPQVHYDMIRLGIGMYGIGVNQETQKHLRYVHKLQSRLSEIRIIEKGESVSYMRRFVADKQSKIGVIPIGYADGLNRHLSEKGFKVWINGKLSPIVGSICMDMCMIDLTNIEAKVGDKVIIFGEENPVENMAKALDTISYEVFTSVSQRIKRVYFHE